VRPPSLAALLVLAAALPGCASVRAQENHDAEAAFASYRTFAQAGPPVSAANLPGYSSLTAERVQRRIAVALAARGLVPDASGAADLVVSFHVEGQPRSDVVGGGWTGWGTGDVYTVNYIEATLVIDIRETARDRLVWHGWGTTDLYEDGVREDEVERVVDAILDQYPPKAR
jgi:hypothetical protein